MDIQEALQRIQELEIENENLRQELAKYEHYKPQGRKTHDSSWQESFNQWKHLYETNHSISEILEVVQISRRTYYRYKAYYDKISQ